MSHTTPHAGRGRLWRTGSIAIVLLLTSACASQPATNPFGDRGRPLTPAGDLTVEVHNTGYYDIAVHAELAGIRHRLGTVRSGESRELRIPKAISRASNFTLVANQILGSEVLRTIPLAPQEGQQITWELGNTRFAHRLSIRD